MVALVEQLLQCKGQQVTITFEDGEIVDALLIDVDPVEHQDITYDVLAVRKSIGDQTYSRTKVYVAPIGTVTAVTSLT